MRMTRPFFLQAAAVLLRCMTLQNRHDCLEALFQGLAFAESGYKQAQIHRDQSETQCDTPEKRKRLLRCSWALNILASFVLVTSQHYAFACNCFFFSSCYTDLNDRKVERLVTLLQHSWRQLVKKTKDLSESVAQIQAEAHNAGKKAYC